MTRRAHPTLGLAPALLCIAALCLAAATPAPGAKKKAAGKLEVSKTVNLPIPDDGPGAGSINGILRSTIEVGKQFRGRKIRDVNVTLQTLGTAGTAPAGDLVAKLASPNGAHTTLITTLSGPFNAPNPSIGPLTLDDEAPLTLGGSNPHSPFELYMPWAGTAQPEGLVTLAVMDDGPARGTWTLTVLDTGNTETSKLVAWKLSVITGPPFRTK
jgi:proprotein convertase P-domain-containing protein